MTEESIKQLVKIEVFPLLLTGDPNWDLPHAKACAFHLMNIVDSDNSLLKYRLSLLFSAYVHDIGYSPFCRKGQGLSRDEYMEAKKKHMDVGVEIVTKLLDNNDFEEWEKEVILKIVGRHDNLCEMTKNYEVAFLEADTLAGLDINFVKPSFSRKDNEIYMKSVKDKRLPLFKHKYAIKEFDRLLNARKMSYADV